VTLKTGLGSFAPSHATDIVYAASVHQRHELSSGRAAAIFLPKLCSQSDYWEPQVCLNESRCLSFQNADWHASSVCRSTVLLEDKELARDITYDRQ